MKRRTSHTSTSKRGQRPPLNAHAQRGQTQSTEPQGTPDLNHRSNVIDIASCKPIADSIATKRHDGARHRAEGGTRAAGRVGGEGTPAAGYVTAPRLRYVLQHRETGFFLADLDVNAGTFKVTSEPALAVPMERDDAENLAAGLLHFGVQMTPFDLLRPAA